MELRSGHEPSYHPPVTEASPEERTRVRTDDVDIGALLGVALGPPPPADFADKVGSKVSLMATVSELTLLLFAAPFDWLRADPSDRESR